MSQEANYSFSIKDGSHAKQPLLTIRGDSAQEFIGNLQAIGFDAGQLLSSHFQIQGVPGATEVAVQNMANAGLNPSVLPQNQPAPQVYQEPAPVQQVQQPPAPAAQTPWGGGQSAATFQHPVCPHGAMQHRESKPGAPRPWKAWMCPSPKGTPDQCDPVWDRDPKYVSPVGS
jgi:hypothetical protein